MNKKHSFLLLISLCCFPSFLLAQQDSSWKQAPTLQLLGFLDVFYAYDFNQPTGNQRQAFFYNHNRHNEFNLNLGLIKLGVAHAKYRANLALQTGTYANDNYAAEPGLLKTIFEANIGLALNKNNSLWLDVGILPSHIGFESALSIDNPTLTRSLLAENSPYFLTGAKLSFSPNEQWEIAGLVVNGWQRIQRLAGNSLPSFGTQVSFSPFEAVHLNWSTFVGTDDPDTTRRMRFFSNLYGQFQAGEKLAFIVGIDGGFQQGAKASAVYDYWFSPIIIGQYSFNKQWKAAFRAEYYQDATGIIIPTNTPNGFQTLGFSLNIDYLPIENISCRVEARLLNSWDRIFETPSAPSHRNIAVVLSVAAKFSRAITFKSSSL